jgi:hypothetical protein
MEVSGRFQDPEQILSAALSADAYWITPSGQILTVDFTHIQNVMRNAG